MESEEGKEKKNISSPDSMLIFTLANKIQDPNLHNICVNKTCFKIGRAIDSDDIISDALISRNQCIITYDFDTKEWMIKDLSSCGTFINGLKVERNSSSPIKAGDVIQFSVVDKFKFIVSECVSVDEPEKKKIRLDQSVLDEEKKKHELFAEEQEKEKLAIKEQLEAKQKEQLELRANLEEMLEKQKAAEGKTEEMNDIIKTLENKINTGNIIETQLRENYNQLLSTLAIQNEKFEEKINQERQKWQQSLDMSKQEKENMEKKLIEDMAIFREQQKNQWNAAIHHIIKREKDIQNELASKNLILEEQLKEAQTALQEKTALAEQLQNRPIPDLTADERPSTSGSNIINKVENIMTDQYTCPICHELFIIPTVLNCGHTFCKHCINSWIIKNSPKKECPNCRTNIVSTIRQIIIENFLDQYINDLSVQHKQRRKELTEERKRLNVQIPKTIGNIVKNKYPRRR